MKKMLVGILLITGLLLFFFLFQKQKIFTPASHLIRKNSPTPTIVIKPLQSALFVPYWTLSELSSASRYNQIIYFGITADAHGIDTTEPGYKNLSLFRSDTKEDVGQKLLTIRLLDQSVNEKVLHDKQLQQAIIEQVVTLAKQYGFSGIVLDLEYNALPFDSVLASTTNFSKLFFQKAHENSLQFYQTIYGDEFYRSRPFDTSSLAKVTDGIFIMSYDLHKANGDPGANFPLENVQDEYTFEDMVHDFSQKVPREKVVVVFGMYGYDWTLDYNNQSTGHAVSISLLDTQKKFLASCLFTNCQVIHDISGATKITYTEGTQNHILWIDGMDAIRKKIEYLKTQGIFNIAYWANGYF